MCFENTDEPTPNQTIKTIVNKNGKLLQLEISTFPVKNEEGAFFAGINIV